MPFTKKQKSKAIAIIKNAIIEKIDKYRLVGDIKPFHERLFSKKRIRETSFFHSCSTTLGVTLFQNIAYLISKDNKKFQNVEKQFEVSGEFSDKAKTVIEDVIYDLGRKKKDTKKRNPDIEKEIKEVLKVSRGGKESTQIADLFLTDDKDKEIYIEIKTTKPNKGEVEKAKRTLLKIVALRNKPVKVFVGMAYNPYEPDDYSWPLPKNYLKEGEDLIIGKQFWDFLGGEGTYKELLKIFEEVGIELKPILEKKVDSLEKII